MSDASIIVQSLKKEIETFQKSRASIKKLLFEKCSADLLKNLQKFIDISLQNPNSLEEDLEIFKNRFFEVMEWE